MKKLTVIALVACMALFAVSCKNQPKEEAVEAAPVEEVAAPAAEEAAAAVENAAAAVEGAAQAVEAAAETVAK